tara:strand:+ start:114732 stop:115694 length:963 start_codon:yes stop_codon:yes gene_type:complete
MKRRSYLAKSIEEFGHLKKSLDDITDLAFLLEKDSDEELENEAASELGLLADKINNAELAAMLSGEHDENNAIVEIHPGAGGTESQDWAEMLMRMYLRWCERREYKTEIINILYGEEAGIKSVTFIVNGNYCYGYLKAESGVHRLVRISPFDTNKRRHTSFASVTITPEISDDIEVNIRDEELKIDTFRSSGAGGQHVNVTDSAVRITHLPTGTIVACQNERSQHKNKAHAMKVLKGKLFSIEQQKLQDKVEGLTGEKKDIKWGSQIRSYVMQPYQLVKDLRTRIENGNIGAVLDGDIDQFITGYLLKGPVDGAVDDSTE